MDFKETVKRIKSLEIQGATNVAKSAVKALSGLASKSKAKDGKSFFNEIMNASSILFSTRPTEPAMRNMINYIVFGIMGSDNSDVKKLKLEVKKSADKIIDNYDKSRIVLSKHGARLIPRKSRIYTHCHSSAVASVIKTAKGKIKMVNNTETRPRFQGRLTATNISKIGIPVTHFVDSAAGYALAESDIMLIGADAVTPAGVYNKVGSGLFAKAAFDRNIPVYICTTTFKVDPETLKGKKETIEERPKNEVWDKPPKGILIRNPSFDLVHPKHITGIISELGIFKHHDFIKTVMKKRAWMFGRS